jgi:CheY-like chemotaxis protein
MSATFEDVGEVAGAIAHDFNNLLSVVLGHAEMLLDEAPSGSRSREHAQAVILAAQRAGRLTRRLLALSREQDSGPAPVDLGEVVTRMERVLHRVLGDDIELVLRAEPGLPKAWLDRSRIEQAIMSLVVNAREAMPGGGRLTIAVGAALVRPDTGEWLPADGQVVLSLVDTGVGMDGEIQARAFESLFSRRSRAAGTGLSMVQRMVSDAGGRIRVRSARGRGTTIEMGFAALPAASAVAAAADPAPTAVGGGESILLIESDESLRRTLGSLLRRLGYRVDAARSAAEVEPVAADRRPDLIILDVAPADPHEQGQAARLRALAPGAPVLLISEFAEGSRAGGPGDAGAAYLPKPVVPAQLAATVRSLLDAR